MLYEFSDLLEGKFICPFSICNFFKEFFFKEIFPSNMAYSCAFINGELQHYIDGVSVSQQVAENKGFGCPIDLKKLHALDPDHKRYITVISNFTESFSKAMNDKSNQFQKLIGQTTPLTLELENDKKDLVIRLKMIDRDNNDLQNEIERCLQNPKVDEKYLSQCQQIQQNLDTKEVELKSYIAKISELQSKLHEITKELSGLKQTCQQEKDECDKKCKA